MPANEYKITAALLENYEFFLLSVFTDTEDDTRNKYSVYNNPYSPTHYSWANDNTNTLYGSLLDNKKVFIPNVIALYKNLSTYYKNQLLVSVRYALTGVHIEHGVYPAITETLQRSYQVQTYQEVKQGRMTWHVQKEQLAQSVSQGLVDNGSNIASVIITNNTTNNANHSDVNTPIIRTHYVTYASDNTEGLQNLLDSAKMSGITIEVCFCCSIVSFIVCNLSNGP